MTIEKSLRCVRDLRSYEVRLQFRHAEINCVGQSCVTGVRKKWEIRLPNKGDKSSNQSYTPSMSAANWVLLFEAAGIAWSGTVAMTCLSRFMNHG